MTGPDNLPPPGDADETRLLREGLRTKPLSEAALKRIRAATEAEWRATVAPRPRRWLPVGIAASLLGVALAVGLAVLGAFGSAGDGEVLATLVRSENPGMLQMRAFRSDVAVNAGAALRSERAYEARGQALLSLPAGGNLRLAAGSTIEVVGKDTIRLDAGQLYVDIPSGAQPGSTFVVTTPAGEFRHVGTQFALGVVKGATRLRVREGRVLWVKSGGEPTGSSVEAGTEIHISPDGEVSRRAITPSDDAWDWVAATTPDFEVENRPLQEFLAWVARESGRKLVLADEATRQQVATIRMHGSVEGLTPLQALSAVMAATALRYELSEREIRVSFGGDSRAGH
jgi:ferric-dicitrate binding protein FerR (iron transport regulator)